MKRQEFRGKSLDEAIDAAAKAFGVDRGAVRYEVSPEEKGGLLSKLFSRNIRISAWSESTDALSSAARDVVRDVLQKKSNPVEAAPRSGEGRAGAAANGKQPKGPKGKRESSPRGETQNGTQGAEKQASTRADRPRRSDRQERPARNDRGPRSERAPRPERAPRRERAVGEGQEGHESREFLTFENEQVVEVLQEFRGVFLKMFDVEENNCRQERDNLGNVMISVEDSFLEETLARSDKLAVAFEHLFKRVAQKRVGDVSSRVFLTAGNAGEIRQNKLRDYAISVAEKVKQSGRSITVASKSSQERRVIHMALDGFPGIATKSVGAGEHRKLVIFSTDRSHRGAAEGGELEAGQTMGGEAGERKRRRRRRKSRGGQRQGGNGAAPVERQVSAESSAEAQAD
jgi:spoIIIJ-associated protein